MTDLSPQPWPTDLEPDEGGFVHVPPGLYHHPDDPGVMVSMPHGGMYGTGPSVDVSSFLDQEPRSTLVTAAVGTMDGPPHLTLNPSRDPDPLADVGPVIGRLRIHGQGATYAEAVYDVTVQSRRAFPDADLDDGWHIALTDITGELIASRTADGSTRSVQVHVEATVVARHGEPG